MQGEHNLLKNVIVIKLQKTRQEQRRLFLTYLYQYPQIMFQPTTEAMCLYNVLPFSSPLKA